MDSTLEQVLTTVGPRLRFLRQQRDMTLADLSAATNMSVSTLSRLESGQRRPNLARAHRTEDLPAGHVEVDEERTGAVALVPELRATWPGRDGRSGASRSRA
jgi:transcriptional regulator with XRE-family HTH domain